MSVKCQNGQVATKTSPRAEAGAMLAAAVFPTLAAWLYFMALTNWPTTVQQTAYTAGKILQFGFPVVWAGMVRRQRPSWRRPQAAGVVEGVLFGGAVLTLMLVAFSSWLLPAGYFGEAGEAVAEKVRGFGVDSPAKFLALGIFYCGIHSFLEEYYCGDRSNTRPPRPQQRQAKGSRSHRTSRSTRPERSHGGP
ncbi:MAG TPA: hypothetical protein VHP11_17115 [Tepidisphaeraceae bacterium]|nr:hypothetical protein [Tepidisphaeraceae bacterium]